MEDLARGVFAMDEAVRRKAKPICAIGCCCIWTIVTIILLSVSWKTVGQGEVALLFNHWTQSVTGEPMVEPGMKYVGPFNGLVRYPSVYQMMYFDKFDNYEAVPHEMVKPPILSRTYDGLQVNVKVSFQWKLEPQYLKGIYEVLGGAEDLDEDQERPEDKPSFVEALVRFSRGTLTQVCAEYTASQFFANQTLVEVRMFDRLAANLNKSEHNFFINVQGLQLRSVDLPNEYEDAIAETQKEEQDFQTASAERATKEMQMSTVVMQASQQVRELKKASEANASKIEVENAAWVEQYRLFQTKQAEAYGRILNELAEASDPYANLYELMRQKALKEHTPDALTLSM